MGRKYNYRYIASSEAGFVQQVVRCVSKGYCYYVFGTVGQGKSAVKIDQKLLGKFDIAKSPSARCRAKQRGEANVQYIRFENFWLMMCTAKGRHHWKDEHTDAEGNPTYFDFRDKALEVGRYAIALRRDGQDKQKYRVRVALNLEAYKDLRAFYFEKGKHWSVERLADSLRREVKGLLAYRPIRVQMIELVRQINKRRRVQGFDRVPYRALEVPSCVYSVTVFEEPAELDQEAA